MIHSMEIYVERISMRGMDRRSGELFSYVDLEARVRPDHPLRAIRAMLLQAFYSVRSERQLMERLEFDLLFRWFVGLGVDDPAWDHSTFSKNRDRLLDGEIAAKFLVAILAQPRVKKLLSGEHFLGRRDADRGVGLAEELQAQGWRGRRPGRRRRAQCAGGLQRPEALE